MFGSASRILSITASVGDEHLRFRASMEQLPVMLASAHIWGDQGAIRTHLEAIEISQVWTVIGQQSNSTFVVRSLLSMSAGLLIAAMPLIYTPE